MPMASGVSEPQHQRPLIGRRTESRVLLSLVEAVRSGQSGAGSIRADLDASELASLLIEAWEGAALRAKVTRSRTPYDRFEAVTVPSLLR